MSAGARHKREWKGVQVKGRPIIHHTYSTTSRAAAPEQQASSAQLLASLLRIKEVMSSRTTNAATVGDLIETAVPTLRVMRLQNPELHMPTAGSLDSQPLLNNAVCLPDSLDVYVGETFTAYLGVINSSRSFPIRRLNVTAQLQTPTQRWQLPSPLDATTSSNPTSTGGFGMDVPPLAGVDAVVSHAIEEAGQHILRVEVSSLGADGNLKTFRKFYRFQVTHPVVLRERTVRAGDAACWVTLSLEYTNNAEYANAKDVMVIADVQFEATDGLSAECVGRPNVKRTDETRKDGDVSNTEQSAVDLYDQSNVMQRGMVIRYLFRVQAASEKAKLRGLAAGDLLGKAVVTWRKAMGEQGRIASSAILCPAASKTGPVFQSGLSVDVAASPKLAQEFPVTVEPIDPPRRMAWQVPTTFQFLVVNHATTDKALQLQFRSTGTGLAVYGPSSLSLSTVSANGGSKVASVTFVALTAGLLSLDGCWVIDLATDHTMKQPPLLDVFVEHNSQ
jgi:hypothetical protein